MPCQPKMPVRDAADTPFSGCRADCLHRAFVLQYREQKVLADEVRKVARENATGGHKSEGEEWDAAHPPFTFRRALEDNRRPRRPDEEAA